MAERRLHAGCSLNRLSEIPLGNSSKTGGHRPRFRHHNCLCEGVFSTTTTISMAVRTPPRDTRWRLPSAAPGALGCATGVARRRLKAAHSLTLRVGAPIRTPLSPPSSSPLRRTNAVAVALRRRRRLRSTRPRTDSRAAPPGSPPPPGTTPRARGVSGGGRGLGGAVLGGGQQPANLVVELAEGGGRHGVDGRAVPPR